MLTCNSFLRVPRAESNFLRMRGSNLLWFLPAGDPNSLPTLLCTHCSFPFPSLRNLQTLETGPPGHSHRWVPWPVPAMPVTLCEAPLTALTLCSHSFEAASCISSWESFSCGRSQAVCGTKNVLALRKELPLSKNSQFFNHPLFTDPGKPMRHAFSPTHISF